MAPATQAAQVADRLVVEYPTRPLSTLLRAMREGQALTVALPVVVEVRVEQEQATQRIYVVGQVEQAPPMTLRSQAHPSTMLVAAGVMA
jgi:hypothetical protein